ncbi:cell wall-binding repeat-containing protein [Gryllotalpicola reticulitermitis]|uniref:Cell wall-binding repeat-containing protein n=1 Tax=Gryllotalpicola reticulitermitis TaxID=1184153 RepID=A0ABV8Q6S1_9MICO
MRLPKRALLALGTAAVLAAGALSVIPTTAADAASGCSADSSGTTPSLSVQNACGNHAMGSAEIPASVSPTSTPTPASSGAASATPAPSVAGKAAAHGLSVSAAATPSTGSKVKGFDVSAWQSSTSWSGAVSDGYKFVFIKSTEGDNYVSPTFNSQWVQAGKAGLLRGTYHFAQPSETSGSVQAHYFYSNGAAMSSDTPGTLPPVLDAESSGCAGLSQSAMITWISSFMSTLKSLTGRTPIIYTYQSWWNNCTGDNKALASAYPLWVADPTPPTATTPRIPAAWSAWTFWQWGSPPFSGGGDANVFESSSLATLTSSYGTYARAAGTDRYATSTSVAQEFLSAAATDSAPPKPGQTVYIASGTTFPDALSGGAAAGKASAPIMLVQSDWISGIVLNELSALKPQKIVILGGPDAVDAAVQKALVQYTASKSTSSVVRIGGSDRYATSADVATTNFSAGVKNAYVAVGTNWPDALSGAAAAAAPATSGPVLLVNSTAIPSAVAQALAKLRPQKITIFGGTTAVNSAVQNALAQYTASRSAGAVVRIGGPDRFQTSELIASKLFSPGVPVAYAASGVNFPDALAGAPLSALSGGAPVVLTNPTTVPAATEKAFSALKPKSVSILGGADAISASVQSVLSKYVVH